MITNADMTIFNKVADKENKRFVYRAHYISAVHFYTDQKATVGDAGIKSADLYKIRIPEEQLSCYMTPEEFARDQTGWTVDNDDLFVLGEYDKDIIGVGDLAKLHRPYGVVSSWSDNRRGGLPHIRIGGTA